MPKEKIEVVTPNEKEHGLGICELFAKTFSNKTYYHRMGTATGGYILNGGYYDWKASRVCMINGEIVSHYGVWRYNSRVGKARLLTAGVGAVMTNPLFAGRGLVKLTANCTMEDLRKSDYDISVLFGIPGFYHKFGYSRAWNPVSVTVDVKNFPPEKLSFKTKAIKGTPLPELEKMYNLQYASTTGTAVKPTYRMYADKFTYKTVGWFDGKGRLLGYIAYDVCGLKLTCVEYVGKADEALAVLLSEARKAGCLQMACEHISEDTGLIHLMKLGECVCSTTYCKNRGPMIAIVNFQSTLRKLCGELSARVGNSGFNNYSGRLLIDNGSEKVGLSLNKGKVAVVDAKGIKDKVCGGNEIASLIYGADDPLFIAELGGFKLTGKAAGLLGALFPKRYASLSPMDRF